MKKALSIIFAIVLLCVSLSSAVLSVSAGVLESDWKLGENAEYIVNGDKTYYPLDTNSYFTFTNDIYEYYGEELSFTDEKTEARYEGSCVYITMGAEDIAVEVEIFTQGEYRENLIYVEQAYLEEFRQVAKGEADNYSTFNYYLQTPFYLDAETCSEWLGGESITIKGEELDNYDWHNFYACDSSKIVNIEYGMVYRDYDTDELYLLIYSDYDKSYFFGDGSFGPDYDQEVTLYKLEDKALSAELIEHYETMPDEELDWLVAEDEVSTTFAAVFCSIVFGFVPFALMVFAVVMLIKVKDKKYHRPYIVMIAGSLVVLLACVGVFIVLL